MFDSIDDWLIIAVVVAILFYGSSKIPQLAHALGRATGEFKKGRLEVEKEIQAQQRPAPNAPPPSATGPVASAPVPPEGRSGAIDGGS